MADITNENTIFRELPLQDIEPGSNTWLKFLDDSDDMIWLPCKVESVAKTGAILVSGNSFGKGFWAEPSAIALKIDKY